MNYSKLRSSCRRLVVELVLVVAAVSVPIHLLRGTDTSHFWRYLVQEPLLLVHVGIAVVLLIEAAALLVRARSWGGVTGLVVATIGAVSVVAAAASGILFTRDGQQEHALMWMLYGWLVAIATYITGWVRASKHLRHQQ